jgi:hypothetical protein
LVSKFLKEEGREMLLSSNVKGFVVCIAVLASAVLLSVLNIVWADCPDTSVRANSPCITECRICSFVRDPPLVGPITSCSGAVDFPSAGDFQCDMYSEGDYCHGTGDFAPCRNACNCIIDPAPNPAQNTCKGINCQMYAAETQMTDDC